MKSLESLLTVEQAAKYLNVRPSTIQRYARQGRLTFIRLPGALRFRQSDLEKWLATIQVGRSSSVEKYNAKTIA